MTRLGSLGSALLAAAVLICILVLPQTASAAPPASVFDGQVPCAAEGDGVTFCTDTPRSTVPAWDGVPIDVEVALPSAAKFGPAPYPLMMMFHGYGGNKLRLDQMQRWLDRGYATFSMTDRGLHESCGSAASRAAAGAACDDGYVRLIDNRYEVRDAQQFAGLLVDEGLVDAGAIGAIGGSYGGGLSMALGALRNRVVMPDYSLVPWRSPNGTPIELAAAAPSIPWTDLAYSLAPNGSTLDYLADAPYTGPVGVEKQSLVGGLYVTGLTAPGMYAPEGSDPTADLVGWQTRLNAGEPYGADAQAIIDELTEHHSSYYIDHSIAPAPMLMSSGFTDDLFPADETIRYYNRTRTEYGNDADLALFFGDFGHPRAQGKSDVSNSLRRHEQRWMDYYVKGEGKAPRRGVTAFTETCPKEVPSGGPYRAPNWAKIAKGEIRYDSRPARVIAANAGDPKIAAAFNPVGGGACKTADGADQPGSASYRLDPAPSGGYTMMGGATVVAKFGFAGQTSQVAARLLDVGPDGQETLVSRGLWRPAAGGFHKQAFQLHPNGWTFAEGHVPKLELLPADTNPGPTGGYGRASDGQQPVSVKSLELRLPVVEKPGTANGLVGAAAKRVLGKGQALASDFEALPNRLPKLRPRSLTLSKRGLIGTLKCPRRFQRCNALRVLAYYKGDRLGKAKLAGLDGGKGKKINLLAPGRRVAFAGPGRPKLLIKISSAELAKPVESKARLKRK